MKSKITDKMVKEVLEIIKKKNITKEEGNKINELMKLRNAENTTLYDSGVNLGQITIDALRRITPKDVTKD